MTAFFSPKSFLALPGHYARAIWLFTKWDLDNMLILVLFGSLCARLTSVTRFVEVAFWVWLHTLFLCIDNQSLSAEEDALNKSWRPIPSKMVTYHEARLILLLLVPVCLAVSVQYNAVPASAGLICATLAYNELGWDRHWLMKNLLNVGIWTPLHFGASIIAMPNHRTTAHIASACVKLGLVIMTTIHAGDFPDVKGDALGGRRTLPMIIPRASRFLLILTILAWSLYPILFAWRSAFDLLPLFVGVFPSYRFAEYHGEKEDKKSSKIYNIWLLTMHVYLAYRG